MHRAVFRGDAPLQRLSLPLRGLSRTAWEEACPGPADGVPAGSQSALETPLGSEVSPQSGSLQPNPACEFPELLVSPWRSGSCPPGALGQGRTVLQVSRRPTRTPLATCPCLCPGPQCTWGNRGGVFTPPAPPPASFSGPHLAGEAERGQVSSLYASCHRGGTGVASGVSVAGGSPERRGARL